MRNKSSRTLSFYRAKASHCGGQILSVLREERCFLTSQKCVMSNGCLINYFGNTNILVSSLLLIKNPCKHLLRTYCVKGAILGAIEGGKVTWLPSSFWIDKILIQSQEDIIIELFLDVDPCALCFCPRKPALLSCSSISAGPAMLWLAWEDDSEKQIVLAIFFLDKSKGKYHWVLLWPRKYALVTSITPLVSALVLPWLSYSFSRPRGLLMCYKYCWMMLWER